MKKLIRPIEVFSICTGEVTGVKDSSKKNNLFSRDRTLFITADYYPGYNYLGFYMGFVGRDQPYLRSLSHD